MDFYITLYVIKMFAETDQAIRYEGGRKSINTAEGSSGN